MNCEELGCEEIGETNDCEGIGCEGLNCDELGAMISEEPVVCLVIIEKSVLGFVNSFFLDPLLSERVNEVSAEVDSKGLGCEKIGCEERDFEEINCEVDCV